MALLVFITHMPLLIPRAKPGDEDDLILIAANDAFELVVLPRIVERLQQLAPNVRLIIVSTEGVVPVNALASGEVDFAWGNFDPLPAGFHTQVMLEETLACLVRKGNPVIRSRLRAGALLRRVTYHGGIKRKRIA